MRKEQNLVNEQLYQRLQELGYGLDIESLENKIEQLQEQYACSGKSELSDYQFDELYGILQQLKPDSRVFQQHAEIEVEEKNEQEKEWNRLLSTNPMRSIRTVQDQKDVNPFMTALQNSSLLEQNNELEFILMEKLNGHAVRAVYEYGKLVHGTLRGRYKLGRTITKHLQKGLPLEVEEWKDLPILEVRAEALVSKNGFERIQDKYGVKTPLSAVTSFIRESSTDEEISCLDFVAYSIELPLHEIDIDSPALRYCTSKKYQLEVLQQLGFNVPYYETLKMEKDVFNSNERLLQKLLEITEEAQERIEAVSEYLTDGCVLQLNKYKELDRLQGSMKYLNGVLALKLGEVYGAQVYKSKIVEVEVMPGKKFLTPKAVIEPVKTSDGRECRVVPLYNPAVMERERLWVGREIYFKFGAETGVTLCREDGSSVRNTR